MPVKPILHIISFDVPASPNYGGIIDVYFRILALSPHFTIHLHAFRKKNHKIYVSDEINEACSKIHYYNRKTNLSKHFSSLPFFVKSRESKSLVENILDLEGVILFEGIHTTAALKYLRNKPVFIRSHNIESEYYGGLRRSTRSWWRRIYYFIEEFKLKKFESQVYADASGVVSISERDKLVIGRINSNTISIYPFTGNSEQPSPQLINQNYEKDRIVFFGNLSVPENELAAMNLIKRVKRSRYNLSLLGKSPSKVLINLCRKQHIDLVENPSDAILHETIQSAEFTVLFSNQYSGVKLKLFTALKYANKLLISKELDPDSVFENNVSTLERREILMAIENNALVARRPNLSDEFSVLFMDYRKAQKLADFLNAKQ